MMRIWRAQDDQNRSIKFAWISSCIFLVIVLVFHIVYYMVLTEDLRNCPSWSLAKDLAAILAGVFCSIIAATTYDLSSRTRTEVRQARIRQEFAQLFGSNDLDGQPTRESTALIILPGYGKPSGSVTRPPVVDLKQGDWHQALCQSISHSARRYLAISDATAVTRIIAIFQELGLPLPKIRADDDPNIDELINDQKIRPVISIGLYSNGFLMNKAIKRTNLFNVLVKWEESKGRKKITHKLELRKADPNQNYADHRETEEFLLEEDSREESSIKEDFCLLAKLKTHEGKTLIVLGGIHETGTLAISRWLKRDQNWRKIADLSDYAPGGTKVQGRCFAAIFPVINTRNGENLKKPEVEIEKGIVRVDTAT